MQTESEREHLLAFGLKGSVVKASLVLIASIGRAKSISSCRCEHSVRAFSLRCSYTVLCCPRAANLTRTAEVLLKAEKGDLSHWRNKSPSNNEQRTLNPKPATQRLASVLCPFPSPQYFRCLDHKSSPPVKRETVELAAVVSATVVLFGLDGLGSF